MVVDEETLNPLQKNGIWNNTDQLVASFDYGHDQILFESVKNVNSNCKGFFHLLDLGDTRQVR
jgi:hypothetical protein